MKFFIDTANLEQIKSAAAMGVLDGVTTNPSLAAKETTPYRELLAEICKVVPGPVSAEVLATEYDGMMKEAKELAAIADNIVVKIPTTHQRHPGFLAVAGAAGGQSRGELCLAVYRASGRCFHTRDGTDRADCHYLSQLLIYHRSAGGIGQAPHARGGGRFDRGRCYHDALQRLKQTNQAPVDRYRTGKIYL
jgi:hypothetical protein